MFTTVQTLNITCWAQYKWTA